MKKTALLFLGIVVVITCFYGVFGLGRRGADPAAKLQSSWKSGPTSRIPSSEVNELIAGLIDAHGNSLTPQQKTLLSSKLTGWLSAVASGDFNDFLAFRNPEIFTFPEPVLEHAATRQQIDSRRVVEMTDIEKAELVFKQLNNITAATLANDSMKIHIGVHTKGTHINDTSGFDPAGHYPAGFLKSGQFLGYQTKPDDVAAKEGRVTWAAFSVAVQQNSHHQELLPIHLTLYWDVFRNEWKPWECYVSITGPSREGELTPSLFF